MTKSDDQETVGASRMPLAARREQLLDSAVRVMSSRGIAATTTRAITEDAGVPQGLFHYCFDSRAALLRALLQRESASTLAMAEGLTAGADTLAEALRRGFDAQFTRVGANREHYAVLSELIVHARTDASLLEFVREQRSRDLAVVRALLQPWAVSSAFDADGWAVTILAGVDGITEAWLTDGDDATRDRAAELLAQAIGMAAS